MGWILLTAVVLLALGILYLWRSQPPKRGLLLSLRLAVYALALSLLWGPSFRKSSAIGKPKAVLLIDNSQSMQIQDPKPRSDVLRKIIKKHREALQARFDLTTFRFGGKIEKSSLEETAKPASFRENKTDIAGALAQLQRETQGEEISLGLLFSDGAHTGSQDPMETAAALSFPLYTVGLGDPSKRRDISIESIVSPDFCFKNSPIQILVNIRAPGFSGKEIIISLKDSKTILATQRFAVPKEESGSITLELTPRSIGRFTYTVEAPFYTGELSARNNRKDFTLEVVRDKIRVLYIAGRPSHEYVFLRNLLKSDPTVELVSFIILRNAHNDTRVPEQQLSLIRFPMDEIFQGQILQFDLFIFDNFNYQRFAGQGFSHAYLANIAKFVMESGGALLFLSGEESRAAAYETTPLASVLPLAFSGEISEENFSTQVREPKHTICALSEETAETVSLWKNLPTAEGVTKSAVREGATLLLETTSGKPLASVWQKGKGRVMAVATHSTWRWALGNAAKGLSAQTYQRFWRQAVRWLTQTPSVKLVRLSLRTVSRAAQEPLEVNVRVFDETYKPAASARVSLWVYPPDGKRIRLETLPVEEPGNFIATFIPETEGKHRFYAEAASEKKLLGNDEVEVAVAPPSSEMEHPEMNSRLLEGLAEKTGGKYFHAEDFDSKALVPKKTAKKIYSGPWIDLWDHPLLYGLLIFILVTEWFIRRRHGLI